MYVAGQGVIHIEARIEVSHVSEYTVRIYSLVRQTLLESGTKADHRLCRLRNHAGKPCNDYISYFTVVQRFQSRIGCNAHINVKPYPGQLGYFINHRYSTINIWPRGCI